MCLVVEFTSECIHSHTEKFSNSVSDAGESCANHTFAINVVAELMIWMSQSSGR